MQGLGTGPTRHPVTLPFHPTRTCLQMLTRCCLLRSHCSRAELLPAWGLRCVATWHWLKISDSGQPAGRLVSASSTRSTSHCTCDVQPADGRRGCWSLPLCMVAVPAAASLDCQLRLQER